MSVGLAKVATGFAMIAEGINEIILKEEANPNEENKHDKVETESQKINITIEEVRAVLAEKSKAGKTKEVKQLLNKFNAPKLTAVNPEDYETLLKEAEVL